MMKVTIEELNLTNNIIPEAVFHQYHFRKTKEFIGKSFVGIGNVQEAFWWNRPELKNATKCLDQNTTAGNSLNLPLLSGFPSWKSNYNILINKHNAPTILHLSFKKDLSENEISYLSKVTTKAIFNTLKALNIPDKDFGAYNNDLLLKGKKICGCERTWYKNIYEEDLCLTLKYIEEKELFDKLTYGKAKPKREITGIFDEYSLNYNKAEFLELYRKNLEESLNEALDKIKATNELINL